MSGKREGKRPRAPPTVLLPCSPTMEPAFPKQVLPSNFSASAEGTLRGPGAQPVTQRLGDTRPFLGITHRLRAPAHPTHTGNTKHSKGSGLEQPGIVGWWNGGWNDRSFKVLPTQTIPSPGAQHSSSREILCLHICSSRLDP